MAAKAGIDAIIGALGPPGGDSEGRKDAADTNEADEGGEDELATHLRAFFKAGTSGRMQEAADAFRAAVASCGGSGGYSKPME